MYAALIAFILGLLIRPKSHNQEHSQYDSSTTTDKQTDNPAIIPARVQVSFSEESEKERRAYQEQYYRNPSIIVPDSLPLYVQRE
jgi:hypothetical protein